ncbi:olfactory receptor 11A1-like [Paramacrobiotus metropolitanus]|uniref:olfactory receptor 11A1-like n=1 Tax=Paramacrobiotus metropolitanus TaxID=2943436 RepID=UPI002445C319|nr:olfactory receptor 11A1-like [Paramacrobiotus metropolitanus]
MTFNRTNITISPGMLIFLQYRTEQLIWYGVMATSCIVGTTGSIFLTGAILSTRHSRRGIGILMVNLLIMVTLQCGVAFPFLIQSYPGVPLSIADDPNFCRRAHFLYNALLPSIDYADLMIGINRCVAVCFPHHYPAWVRPRALYGMVTFSWVTWLFFAVVPQLPGQAVMRSLEPWYSCGVVYGAAWSVTFSTGGIALPVALLFALYLTVFLVVLMRKTVLRRRIAPAEDSQLQRTMQRRFRSTLVFFAVFVCYACCMTPAPLVAPLFPTLYFRYPFMRQVLRGLMTVGTASIPVLYMMLNTQYRRQLLCCWKCREKSSPPEVMSTVGRSRGSRGRTTSNAGVIGQRNVSG